MQVQIEIDDALMERIDKAVEIRKISRVAAFKESLERWTDCQPKTSGLPPDFWNFEPDPDDFDLFEASRCEGSPCSCSTRP
jgi:hypothetical protein